MKFQSLIFKALTLILSLSALIGCEGESGEGQVEQGYGYLQLHLYKGGDTRASLDSLDYLAEAAKIKVMLSTEDGEILTPFALVEQAADASSAELGLQTSKIKLLAGDYRIFGFEVYDALDEPLLADDLSETINVNVVSGGLSSQRLPINVRKRGWVRFRLTKDVSELPATRADGDGATTYPFYQIVAADFTITNQNTGEEIEINGVEVEHTFEYSDETESYTTGYCVSDTCVLVRAGTYKVTRFRTYFEETRKIYETCEEVGDNLFTVTDGNITDTDVPVKLHVTSGYIADAIVLREIWEALDGPNWTGVKWDLDCDVDIWSANSGITIFDDGRIASLDFTGTGARGEMPACIGRLTRLRQLNLGTLDYVPGDGVPETASASTRAASVDKQPNYYEGGNLEAYRASLKSSRDGRESFSTELQMAFEWDGKPMKDKITGKVEAAGVRAMASGMSRQQSSGSVTLTDAPYAPQVFATNITSLPDEINQLTNLEHLVIAYSAIESIPEDMSGMVALTDVEIFCNPYLTEFPVGVATLPNLVSLTFSFNDNVPASETEKGLALINSGACAPTLQLLYLPHQAIETVPDLSNVKNMSLLNVQHSGVKRFEAAFGLNHPFVQFYADHNEISSLPVDSQGYFIGMSAETEDVNFAYNSFTELPDIFSAKSIYVMGTIDFSYNQISSVQNGSSYRGVNCSTLQLDNNKFRKFPREILADSGSGISYLSINGNGMEEIEEGAMVGEYSYYTTTLSLAYNKLEEVPEDFNFRNFPYMTGLDLGYNRFSSFPYTPVNNQSLRVFSFRHQRNADGERCMREWPTGIGSSLYGLRALYLGSNDLRVVDDDLSYLIYYLDISDNPNISIDISDICPYIQAGVFNLFYTKGQDIQGCDGVLDL